MLLSLNMLQVQIKLLFRNASLTTISKKKKKTIKYFKEYLLFYSHVTSNLILLDAKGTESLLSSNECFVKIRFYFP